MAKLIIQIDDALLPHDVTFTPPTPEIELFLMAACQPIEAGALPLEAERIADKASTKAEARSAREAAERIVREHQ